MKYKNVELTELQPSDWDGHPRLMLVWRNGDYRPSALRVEGYVNLEGYVYWITTIEGISNEHNCNSSYDNTIRLQNTYPHCAEIPSIESIYQERIKDLEEQVTRMRNNANEREDEFRRQYQQQERRFREELERVRNENANALPANKLKEVMEIKLPDSLIKELLSKKFGKYKQDFIWEWSNIEIPDQTLYNTNGNAIRFIHVTKKFYDNMQKVDYWLTPDPTMQQYGVKYAYEALPRFFKIYCG
jgi:hypothetical protein